MCRLATLLIHYLAHELGSQTLVSLYVIYDYVYS